MYQHQIQKPKKENQEAAFLVNCFKNSSQIQVWKMRFSKIRIFAWMGYVSNKISRIANYNT
jgi:hypothetical protein